MTIDRPQIELDALRASECRNRQVIDSSNDGIVTADSDGRITYANKRLCQLFGYEQHEILGRQFLDFVDAEDRPKGETLFDHRRRGLSDQIEFRYRRKDGSALWTMLAATPLFDADGEFAGALGVITDITDRKAAERELAETTHRLELVVAALGEFAIAVDTFELAQLAVARCQEICGADGAVISLVDGDEMVYFAASGISTVDRGKRVSLDGTLTGVALREKRTILSNDTEGEPLANQAAIRLLGIRSLIVVPLRSDAEPIGMVSVVATRPNAFLARDVSNLQLLGELVGALVQRRISADHLRASEEQYRLVFRRNPKPMWVYDTGSLRFLAVNEAAILHYGWSEAEFLGMTLRDIRPAEDLPLLEAAIVQDANGQTLADPVRHCTKGNATIWVEITADDIVFDGRKARLVAVDDVSARLAGEREVARINRALRLLSRCHEALVRADDEQTLLRQICEAAVDVGGYRMAWVGVAMNDDRQQIKVLAHAGHEDGYLSEVELTWSDTDPRGGGPVGRAMRSGQPDVTEDLASDAAEFRWVENARRRGFCGLICLPLRLDQTLGVLTLYTSEVIDSSPDELSLLQELAGELAFGLTSLRARQGRQRLESAVVAVAASVSSTTGREFFDQMVRSMAHAVDAPMAVVARLLPGEPRRARTIAVFLDGHIVDNYDYVIDGTPCQYFGTARSTVVPAGVQEAYPTSPAAALGGVAYVGSRLDDSAGEPIGLSWVLFREPITESALTLSTLQIFGARAASEVERQSADARIREQASMLDRARDAILVRDLDGTLRYWNKSAERLYGWTADEAVGLSSRSLLYKDSRQFDDAMHVLMERGDWTGEMRHVNRAGEILNVEVRWTLLRDEAGIPMSVLAITTDITDRKHLEQQFLRAQRMESLGTLAGGIAHDLNNVLAPIMLSLDLLREKANDPDTDDLLDTVAGSARRGAAMVQQVLSFARGLDGQRVDVPIRHVLRDVEKIARDTFPKNIAISTTVGENLWTVVGDATQLHQVLLNLCVNARDALPDGGTIRLTAANLVVDAQFAAMNIDATVGPHVRIGVEDSGLGMAPDIIERIFDPFFTTKEPGKGTGLGLSTSLTIVRSHGGFLRVDSEPRRGSVFTVHLPATTIVAPVAPAVVDPTALTRGSGQLVLIVDDEAPIRRIMQRTLETYGYRVIAAADGAEAVRLFASRASEIAVVVTDMMMPVMDGTATIHALRTIDPSVRIVAASGVTDGDRVARAAAAGVEHYLSKPFTADTLLTILGDVLRRP